MKYIFPIVTGLLVISFLSCKKQRCNVVADDTPVCIVNIINDLKNKPVRTPAATVYEYTFQDQKVYYVTSDCCDQYNFLYDGNCNILCAPDGGFSGKGDGGCTGFFTARTDERLIWRDPR